MPNTVVAHSSELRIFETEEFKKALTRLGPPRFLRGKLDTYVYPQLRRGPFFGPNIRKLQGYEPATWRYRMVGIACSTHWMKPKGLYSF